MSSFVHQTAVQFALSRCRSAVAILGDATPCLAEHDLLDFVYSLSGDLDVQWALRRGSAFFRYAVFEDHRVAAKLCTIDALHVVFVCLALPPVACDWSECRREIYHKLDGGDAPRPPALLAAGAPDDVNSQGEVQHLVEVQAHGAQDRDPGTKV